MSIERKSLKNVLLGHAQVKSLSRVEWMEHLKLGG